MALKGLTPDGSPGSLGSLVGVLCDETPPQALIPYECHLQGLMQGQSRPLPWASGQGSVSEEGMLPARPLLGILLWTRGPFPSLLCSLPSLCLECLRDCFCPDESYLSSQFRASVTSFRESPNPQVIRHPQRGPPRFIRKIPII